MLRASCRLKSFHTKLVIFATQSVSKPFCSMTKDSSGDSKGSEERPNEHWDILSAVCIERTPIITRDLNELEVKVANLFERLELEGSKKCDFELKYQEEKVQFEKLQKSRTQDDETEATIPSQDFIDANTAEINKFQFGSRTVEADKNNDVKSLDRRLDSHLLLVIKKKLGEKSLWHLPQDKNREDETLRETAERIVKDTFGGSLRVKFRSNAPAGFYKFKYPRKGDGHPVGAKVFFYKAKYQGGGFEPKDCEDFQWAAQNELEKLFIQQYYKDVRLFLIDEENKDCSPSS